MIGATGRDGRRGPDPAGADGPLLRRVRWRLVAWSAGATLVVLVVLAIATYVAVDRSLTSSGEARLATRAGAVVNYVRDAGERPGPPIDLVIGGPSSGTFAYVITPNGRVFGPNQLQFEGLPDAAAIGAAASGRVDVREVEHAGIPFRVRTEAVTRGGAVYVVQVVEETLDERRTLSALTTALVAVGALAVLGSIGIGFLYAGRALVPIRDALRRQREFAADASHELRTPLAVIRASVEHLERHPEARVDQVGDALVDLRAEVDHLTALVGDLLLLARTDSGVLELEPVPMDLTTVAEEAVAAATPLAAQQSVRLILDPTPVPMLADPLRLRQLVTILVDNAVAHSPAGGTVTVRTRAGGTWALLEVEDQGAGIRPEDLPHVFDRFYRAPGAPSGGTGLGLAIAAWIVERHGGTITASDRQEGGARFAARLPLAVQRTHVVTTDAPA
jgi:signal transduction histidine kinase